MTDTGKVKMTGRARALARILSAAAAHPNGVASFSGYGVGVGFSRRAWQRNVDILVDGGLLEPNAHGDYYLTALGALTIEQDRLRRAAQPDGDR